MAIFSKLLLSASINGKQISITGNNEATSTPIHTGVAGSSSLDEVYIYASNNNTGDSTFTLAWGGISSQDLVIFSLPSKMGRILLADGKLINNSLVINGWSNVTGVNIDGYINRIV